MSPEFYECQRCGQKLYAWSNNFGCTGDVLLHHDFSVTEIKIAPPPPEDLNLQELNMEGTKHDSGKPRWELLPYDAVRGVVEVLTDGAKKYSDRNWELGIAYGRVFGSLQRHLTAWWNGENNDPESGRSHLDHAACELMFLSAYEKRGFTTGHLDDRPYKSRKDETGATVSPFNTSVSYSNLREMK